MKSKNIFKRTKWLSLIQIFRLFNSSSLFVEQKVFYNFELWTEKRNVIFGFVISKSVLRQLFPYDAHDWKPLKFYFRFFEWKKNEISKIYVEKAKIISILQIKNSALIFLLSLR